MQFAIISDVHANLEALSATLKAIKKEEPEALWFLGDIVGYGPNPDECVEVLKKEAQLLLAGNHDRAVIGLTETEYFNPHAKAAVEWTMETMSNENKSFLKGLPIFKILRDEGIYLVHSSPKEPEEWHYILSTWDAYINFQFFNERICFIGHSHYPFIVELKPEGEISIYKDYAKFKEGCRYMINVGSVGQPRDGNPDAAYAILKDDSIEIKRLPYDIVSTQRKMREARLPSFLIERLSRGV